MPWRSVLSSESRMSAQSVFILSGKRVNKTDTARALLPERGP